jgi:hypothetical protein
MRLILVFIIGLLPSLVVIVYAAGKAKKRKLLQDSLLTKNEKFLQNGKLFRVRYCTEARFKKFFKFFPWEATGILCINDEKILFSGHAAKGQEIMLELAKEDAAAEWVGKNNWFKNGLAAWLVIKAHGAQHYFTSETGAAVFGSHDTTKAMYDTLTNPQGVPNAPTPQP